MRIDVFGDDSISREARTYAEYRLFAALPHVTDITNVRHAGVVLRRAEHDRKCGNVSCIATIELDTGEILRVSVNADHPYGAVNRMVERLKDEWRPAERPTFQREHQSISD